MGSVPREGIVDTWADTLGFPAEARPVESYYRICRTEGMTVREVAMPIASRLRKYGQTHVLLVGDEGRRASRMAIGTGVITGIPEMHALGTDLILATYDGMNFWDSGLWAVDSGVPLLLVNHATAEKQGMSTLAEYLCGQFPGITVRLIYVAFPYSVLP